MLDANSTPGSGVMFFRVLVVTNSSSNVSAAPTLDVPAGPYDHSSSAYMGKYMW